MAFETLKNVLGQEILAKRAQDRKLQDPSFLANLKLLEEQTRSQQANREIALENLRTTQKKQEALNQFNSLRVELENTPIDAFDIPPHLQAQLDEAKALNDPGLVQDTENRIKFILTAQTDPNKIKDLLPVLGQSELGTDVLGDPNKSETLEPRKTQRRDIEGRAAISSDLIKTFENVSQDDLKMMHEQGLLTDKALRELQPRVTGASDKLDPFEQARQSTLGRKAGEAQVSLENVGAITADVVDLFANFDAIPDDFRGPGIGTITQLLPPQINEKIKTYENTKKLTLTNIAKQLGEQVGVLTDRDIEIIAASLPELTDSDKVVQDKKKFVANYIDRRIRAKQRTARLPETGGNIPKELIDPNFDIKKAEKQGFGDFGVSNKSLNDKDFVAPNVQPIGQQEISQEEQIFLDEYNQFKQSGNLP